jgi:hypothetical protein
LPCNAETATAVELRQLVRQYREFLGKCVAVRGWSFGRALYAEQSASQVEDREVADNLDGSRIGIYRNDEEPIRATDSRPVLMVGTLCDCAALWEGSLMAVGYCHNHLKGPFLSVADMHPAR